LPYRLLLSFLENPEKRKVAGGGLALCKAKSSLVFISNTHAVIKINSKNKQQKIMWRSFVKYTAKKAPDAYL